MPPSIRHRLLESQDQLVPLVSGRNEDYDLTRGGSVPYRPEDFVEYLIKPMFDGDVSANGFVLKNDIDQLLLNGFYLGNIARGSAEVKQSFRGISTHVLMNSAISS